MKYVLIILIYSTSGPFAVPVEGNYNNLSECKSAGHSAKDNETTAYAKKHIGFTCFPSGVILK